MRLLPAVAIATGVGNIAVAMLYGKITEIIVLIGNLCEIVTATIN